VPTRYQRPPNVFGGLFICGKFIGCVVENIKCPHKSAANAVSTTASPLFAPVRYTTCRRIPFMSLDQYGLYLVAVLIAVLTPGPAVMLGITNSIRHNTTTSFIGALGCVSATGLMGALSAMGLGAMIMASAILFDLIRFAGAAYLIWLGIKIWRASGNPPVDVVSEQSMPHPGYLRCYLRGFLISASNPKSIAFFTALFPMFLDPEAPLMTQFAVLDTTFVLLSFASIMGYSFLAARSKNVLLGSARRWFNRVAGGIFISFGLALAASHR
jgi:threonine/homoserine/homoserine lactone efflux protein